MNFVGLDIGGANTKIALRNKQRSYPFELWKRPQDLGSFLRKIIPLRENAQCAVTMTGELADGYPSKQQGVAEIVAAVEKHFPDSLFYQTNGKFVHAHHAAKDWQLTAAANWHATAVWLSQNLALNDAIVIDVGSTTTDVTPIEDGLPKSDAVTDLDRLTKSRLIYTGVRRSSIAGLVSQIVVKENTISVANEFFATIEDVYLVLELVSESKDCDTADGRPKSTKHAKQRLARMVCSDVSEVGESGILDLASCVLQTQKALIGDAIKNVMKVSEVNVPILVCGEGEWLAVEVLKQFVPERNVFRVSEKLTQSVADCACAVAVRELAILKAQHVTSG
jgi:probable H4MPT-linked C1 transfer pathway protein